MPAVVVFGSSQTDPSTADWREAELVGRSFALAGVSVITGGYGGTMEAVSKGAAEAGGHAIGITAPTLFPARSGANEFVTELIEADSLSDRIGRMMVLSQGCVALPGSIGTAAELLIAWNTNHILRRSGLPRYPAVAVGEHWQEFRSTMVGRLSALADDIHWVDTGIEASDWMLGQIKPLT